jgi:glucosamine-6-phosphate deaminase
MVTKRLMKLIKVESPQAGARLVAQRFAEISQAAPASPVGLATGGTMVEVYKNILDLGFKPKFEDAFALDEYLGLEPHHPNSYARYLNEHFVSPLGFKGQLHVPGQGKYQNQSGYDLFEHSLASLGPLSVQLLGLGPNGHLAFNEPGSSLTSRTREVELAAETIAANRQYFDPPESIPPHAVSQGLATIAQAQNLLVAVFGEHKREALQQALSEQETKAPFAAIRSHPNLTVFTDIEL